MRVAVTGGAGFLGSHVADVLRSEGHEVTVIDLAQTTRQPSLIVNILDRSALRAAFAGADAVCHLAGVGDVYVAQADPAAAARANVEGSAVAANAAADAGVARFVYASTWEVYGEPQYQPLDEDHPCAPDHPYSITKLAGERVALAIGKLRSLHTVALRLGTAYGTRMRPNSVFSIFIQRARRGEPLVLHGSGGQARQFTHASDIGRGFLAAIERGRPARVYNLVGDEVTTIADLAHIVVDSFPTRIEHVAVREFDVPSACVSSERARSELGWHATVPLREGMRELMEAATNLRSVPR